MRPTSVPPAGATTSVFGVIVNPSPVPASTSAGNGTSANAGRAVAAGRAGAAGCGGVPTGVFGFGPPAHAVRASVSEPVPIFNRQSAIAIPHVSP